VNEDKLKGLMQGYTDSMGECRRPAVTVRKRQPWVATLATAGLVVAISGIVLWPRKAAANPLQRMEVAIANAHTMEVTTSTDRFTGKWQPLEQTYYRNGMWRWVVRIGWPIEVTYVLRDGKALTDFHALDHATLGRSNDVFFNGMRGSNINGLEYAKMVTDVGSAGLERKIAVHEHDPVGGVATYLLTMDRESDKYHAEILVDKKTDLPIREEVSDGFGPQHLLLEFRFNADLPDSLFALTSTKPIHDIDREQGELANRWEKPLADAQGTRVRDVCVTSDGTVWVLVTAAVKEGVEKAELPNSLVATNGARYLRPHMDLVPSSIKGVDKRFEIQGEDVYIEPFVPVDMPKSPPASATVNFAVHTIQFPGLSEQRGAAPVEDETRTVSIRQESGMLPSYFPALDIDEFSFQIPRLLLGTRGEELKKLGRIADLAKVEEQIAESGIHFIRGLARESYTLAAKYYRQAGDTANAERVEKLAAAIPIPPKRKSL